LYIRAPALEIETTDDYNLTGSLEQIRAVQRPLVVFYRRVVSSDTALKDCDAKHCTGQSRRAGIGDHIPAYGWSLLTGESQR